MKFLCGVTPFDLHFFVFHMSQIFVARRIDSSLNAHFELLAMILVIGFLWWCDLRAFFEIISHSKSPRSSIMVFSFNGSDFDFWTNMLTLFKIKILDIRVAETLLFGSSSYFVVEFFFKKKDLLCERVVCVSMWHGMTRFSWNWVALSPSLYFPEIQQLAIKIENEYGFVIRSARTDYPPVLWKPTCDQVETPFNGRLSLTGISSL